jgi:hypothetical protein
MVLSGNTCSLNLGCLHPVARVISYDVGFNPSTQRHYRSHYQRHKQARKQRRTGTHEKQRDERA